MKDESGFTLIEVMVAGMLTMLLAIPAFMLLQRANEFPPPRAAASRSTPRRGRSGRCSAAAAQI